MPKQFDTPSYFKSEVFTQLKKNSEKNRKDFSPYLIETGAVIFKVARYFGFCYGVENAIEIAYKAVRENPGKRVFLLSDMIHNPLVNGDLNSKGVKFLQRPDGTQLIPFSDLTANDVVILPAFGVSLENLAKLKNQGIDVTTYNATCPFVEKVWKRSNEIGERGYSVIIHGKYFHEETRATFSHSQVKAPSLIVRDMKETKQLCDFIRGEIPAEELLQLFAGKYSEGFDPQEDLQKIGVVNQTTMLAEETREIADYIRETLLKKYGPDKIKFHYADTRDTLCYATSENQSSVKEMIDSGGDIAIVVGGASSSNTSHLAKLAATKVPSFHIEGEKDIISNEIIRHVDPLSRTFTETYHWYPETTEGKKPVFLLTAGASTPDSILDGVISKIGKICERQDFFM